jgi:hypothetical protein
MTLINMPLTSMVPALLQGQVDAILGSMDAYQIQLQQQGAKLDNFPFADHGVPTVSTSIFAADSFIKDHPDILRKFIAASLKGWSFGLDHPEKAIEDLKAIFPDMNVKFATAELAAIGPLLCSGGAKYIGKAEDAQWAQTQQLLAEVKLLPEDRTRRVTTRTSTCRRRARCGLAANSAGLRHIERGRGRAMSDRPRLGYRYEGLHVGMRFRSPGRTILDADLMGFAGLTAISRNCTRAMSTRRRASSAAA